MKKKRTNFAGKVKFHNTLSKFKYTVMLFMLIPVLLFNSFMIIKYSKSLSNDLSERHQIAFDKIQEGVKQQFNDITRAHTTLSNNLDLAVFVADTEAEFKSVDERKELTKLILTVDNAMLYTDYVSRVSVYSIANGNMINGNGMAYVDNTEIEWYRRYKEEGITSSTYSNGDYIVVTKPIQVFTEQVSGIMIFEFPKSELIKALVIDEYGCDIAVKLNLKDGEELLSSGDVNVHETRSCDINIVGGELQLLIGEKDYSAIKKDSMAYAIVSILICLGIAYIISTFCASFLYKSVTKVLANMGTVSESSVESLGKNVYEEDEKKDMELKLANALDKLQSAQLTSLQMQINPHFVFNVLNYVNVEILRDDESNEKASKIIVLLSNVLSYAMREPKYSALILEEIEMTKKYIEIEKIKSDINFEVVWNVDDEVKRSKCVKLFLQPIVENSIMHGIKKLKDKEGRIEISGKKENDSVVIVVSDNGTGMTKDRLKVVQGKLEEGYADYSKHIGLRNVNERIKMIYGKGSGVSIDSDSSGTRVTIRIAGTDAKGKSEQ